MSLNEQLRAVLELAPRQIPAEALAVMERAARELEASGLAKAALTVGDQAPRFALPDAHGTTVALDDLLAQGPVVISFYRGAWCPYCNLELRALQQSLDDFHRHGARLVAISPQLPDQSLTLIERHELAFDVLSDVGSQVSREFGLAFDLTDELAAVYQSFGIELERVNGGHARTLPIPATYLLDHQGVIRWAHVNTDYTRRAEPADIVTALAELH
ncbi:peroxiredoxin-like family protein [Allostreptomyces psammosilenae]|uniref:thioredoxin-dependent peroxiredoxin n=1 Tax=Allostreptomyces psammosilenae TaxID=1892865 RepID=A0A852ZUW2_9ACTN|nr:peroxiredoxin-like family protein [Allostreptomyces psammosilenae]NYI06183.1 peroxiredoxin [Allostreptomyces psammosilenae]